MILDVQLQRFDPNIPNIPLNWSTSAMNIMALEHGVQVNSSSIWSMRLFLLNSFSDQQFAYPDTMAELQMPNSCTTGATVNTWIMGKFDFVCEGMSLKDFPFDTQSCVANLQYNDYYYSQVIFVPLMLGNSSTFPSGPNDEWKMLNTSVTCYPCCIPIGSQAEYFPSFAVTVTLSCNYYSRANFGVLNPTFVYYVLRCIVVQHSNFMFRFTSICVRRRVSEISCIRMWQTVWYFPTTYIHMYTYNLGRSESGCYCYLGWLGCREMLPTRVSLVYT